MLSIYMLIEGVRQNQSTWPVSDNAVRPLLWAVVCVARCALFDSKIVISFYLALSLL